MANKIPSWCKNAVATSLGWAHPFTGEQLVSHSALENTVDFYRPNAGDKSFLDPNGEVKAVLQYEVKGNRVDFRVHSLEKVLSVTWYFNGVNAGVGGLSFTRVFEEDGLQYVTAELTVEIDGVEDTIVTYATVRIGDEPHVAPYITSVNIRSNFNNPVSVGLDAFAIITWNGNGHETQDLDVTYQWNRDGVAIAGQTIGAYTPVAADEGHMLSVTVTASNSAGSDTFTSPEVTVLPAV